MIKNEAVRRPELGMKVYHKDIYGGNEKVEIVGIRKDSVELEGDFSGGTHNVTQSDWFPLKGTFRKRKVCDRIAKYGTCNLPNIHCSHPGCESYV